MQFCTYTYTFLPKIETVTFTESLDHLKQIKLCLKQENCKKKFRSTRKFKNDLENFDKYLKYFHYNPGTCADLTVTTLANKQNKRYIQF